MILWKISLALAECPFESWLVIKDALCLAAASLALCLPVSAQQTYRSDLYSTVNNSFLRFPSLTLPDRSLFSFSSAFTRMETTTPDFLRTVTLSAPLAQRRIAYVAPVAYSKDSPTSDVSRRNLFDYVHGEMGFLYGSSIGGPFSGDVEQGYIIGEAGDDKFHITAGAYFENSSVRLRRH